MQFTTVVAVDARTIEQLFLTWPTWLRNKPEILRNPMLLLCDGTQRFKFNWLAHPELTIVWTPPKPEGWTQREHMLSSFVYQAPRHVHTDYWLKIDADSVAMRECEWINDTWLDGRNVLIASPWGYTKPGAWIPQLHKWATTHPVLSKCPPLDWPAYDPTQELYHYPRLISRQCFVHTEWSRTAASLAPERLPVPSQDTYHWFVAELMRQPMIRTREIKQGWTNRNSRRGLEMAVVEAWGEPAKEFNWC